MHVQEILAHLFHAKGDYDQEEYWRIQAANHLEDREGKNKILLAQFYRDVRKNWSQATHWYQQSAEQGGEFAWFARYALLAQFGRDVKRN
jgi:TPR repeat protein